MPRDRAPHTRPTDTAPVERGAAAPGRQEPQGRRTSRPQASAGARRTAPGRPQRVQVALVGTGVGD
ncbi:MAG: hypothetical protein PUE38_06610, partial [Olsenella sp.]|nr:hypothetical protein [Olsenella sp.]